MKKVGLSLVLFPILLAGCSKCVECEVKLKQSQEVVGYVDEYCGTNKEIKGKEDQLSADHTCIECIVVTGFGPTTSGVNCGDREFTDSLESAWKQGAFDIGTTASCTYYRDTVDVTCVLKQ
ncbi:MAG: hypothetical protein K9J17_08980 [Flavobacteriales bacterium]|nr:hypothetical protein [Flavobacteriales bacterium]